MMPSVWWLVSPVLVLVLVVWPVQFVRAVRRLQREGTVTLADRDRALERADAVWALRHDRKGSSDISAVGGAR